MLIIKCCVSKPMGSFYMEYIYNLIFRSTVQMLMSILDYVGAKRRRKHRLKRRVYQNKVRVKLTSTTKAVLKF